ncbi:hypothetical protein [Pandoraea anapnoica]|nr:hypothetical protein [Pandoraea anapnoica]
MSDTEKQSVVKLLVGAGIAQAPAWVPATMPVGHASGVPGTAKISDDFR